MPGHLPSHVEEVVAAPVQLVLQHPVHEVRLLVPAERGELAEMGPVHCDDVGLVEHQVGDVAADERCRLLVEALRVRIRDLDRREIAVVTPLVALIIVLGVYPQPLLDLIRPAVAATVSDVGGNAHGITPVHPTSSTDGGK